MLVDIAVFLLAVTGVVALVLGAIWTAMHALLILGTVCLVAAFVTAAVKVIK